MTKKRLWVGVATLLSLGIVGLARHFATERSRSRLPAGLGDIGASGDGMIAVPEDYSRLRGEIAAMRVELATLQAAEARAGAQARIEVPISPQEHGPEPDSAERAKVERDRRVYLDHLETSFREEQSDPAWAAATTNAIRRALSADDVGLIATEMDCRSRSCRVVLADAGPEAVKALPWISTHLGEVLQDVTVDKSDDGRGHERFVLYMSRHDPGPDQNRM